MPYHPNIPQATDDPTDSQSQILDNFGALNTQYQQNHTALTSSSNTGMHTKIFFPTGLALTADPNLTSPQTSLYPKILTTGSTEVFFQNGTLPTNVSQLTNLPIVNGIITNVTYVGTTVTITSDNHELQNGNLVTIDGVYGVTGLNSTSTYTVANRTANTFEVTATVAGAYIANTGYFTSPSLSNLAGTSTRFGMKTPWGLIINWGFTDHGPQYFAVPYTNATPNILTGQLTSRLAFGIVIFGQIFQDRFSWSASAGTPQPYYMVIGT